MKRKTSTPIAAPRGAEVIQLSDRRPPQNTSDNVTIITPEGALPNDKFHAITIPDRRPDLKARKGALLICYLTDDVRDGDVAAIRVEDCRDITTGKIYFSECYVEVGGESFHRSKVEVIGRIVEMQIGGKRIAPRDLFRSIHPIAQIYQFKQRAKRSAASIG
jgi:hypothetical protein